MINEISFLREKAGANESRLAEASILFHSTLAQDQAAGSHDIVGRQVGSVSVRRITAYLIPYFLPRASICLPSYRTHAGNLRHVSRRTISVAPPIASLPTIASVELRERPRRSDAKPPPPHKPGNPFSEEEAEREWGSRPERAREIPKT